MRSPSSRALALFLTLPALATPGLCASAPPRADEILVEWKRKPRPLEELAAELGEAPARAARAWSAWAEENDYRMHLSDDGRVLLVLRARSKGTKELALIERTCDFVDRLLAAPPEEPGAAAAGDAEPETIVLIQARDSEPYAKVLDRLVELEPYLEDWAGKARGVAGFTLFRPLAAAWMEQLDGQEEWDIRNELVHRLARLLLVRRSGEQPYWLESGFAWHVEIELLDGVYCFPHREEFVYAAEHGAWGKDLKRALDDAPLDLARLAAWRRGTYDGERARESWGLARFLASRPAGILAAILADMRALRAEKGVVRHADGSWELLPEWEPSAADTQAMLARHLGEGFLDELRTEVTGRRRWR